MEYPYPSGGCIFLPPHYDSYSFSPEESGDEVVTNKLELIGKDKNVFGDTVYQIREENGQTCVIHENELEGYLKRKGVSSLNVGQPFLYIRKK
jgi:hypothetical protein